MVRAPVGRDENKVFIMSSANVLKTAEGICDTDFNRRCTGDVFVLKNWKKRNIDTSVLLIQKHFYQFILIIEQIYESLDIVLGMS